MSDARRLPTAQKLARQIVCDTVVAVLSAAGANPSGPRTQVAMVQAGPRNGTYQVVRRCSPQTRGSPHARGVGAAAARVGPDVMTYARPRTVPVQLELDV
jgi:hypothetical protein